MSSTLRLQSSVNANSMSRYSIKSNSFMNGLLWRSFKEFDSCVAHTEPPLLILSRFHSEEFGYLRRMISQDGLGRSFHDDKAKERLPSIAQAERTRKGSPFPGRPSHSSALQGKRSGSVEHRSGTVGQAARRTRNQSPCKLSYQI